VNVPWLAFFGVDKLIVAVALLDEPDRLTEEGETAQVAFGGPPLHASDSVPVNPLTEVRANV
jgi:hypothetical protein